MVKPFDPYLAPPPYGEGGQDDPDLENLAPQFIDADAPDADPNEDDTAAWSAAQQGLSWYPETTLDVKYEFDPGAVVATPAGPDGAPGEVLKLRAASWTKVLQFSFERLNEWPMVPSWASTDANLVPLHASLTLAMPKRMLGNQKVYRVSGTYVWALLAPPSPGGVLPTSGDPATTDSPTMNGFPLVNLDPNMLPAG